MKRRWLQACSVAGLALLAARAARAEEPVAPSSAPRAAAAPSSAECAQAYEQAQVQRKSGQLADARDSLRLCARDECPAFIQSDCLSWYGEVQGELPTLVFSATSAGRDLIDVTVTSGDELLALRLEGQVIELDPGEHDLTFSAAGMQPKQLRFVVARGERNRLVRVELTPEGTSRLPGPNAPLGAEEQKTSLTVPAILAGVGLAGVGGFVALGAWGRASESELADSCAPRCESGSVSATRTKYVLADVSLGVGAVGFALAAYAFFRAEPAPARAARGVGLQAGAGDLRVTYGGRF